MLNATAWVNLFLACVLVPSLALAEAPPDAGRPSQAEGTAGAEAPVETTPAKREKKKRKKKRTKKAHRKAGKPGGRTRTVGFDFRAFIDGGFQHGAGVRRFDSPYASVGFDATPKVTIDPLRLEFPLEYAQVQIPVAEMSEQRVAGAVRARLRATSALRLFGELGALGVWRPNWPDPYQPLANGELETTDRYSYLRKGGDVGAQLVFDKGFRARLSYSYTLWDYWNDPAFDAVDDPNHLTPSDHDENALKALLTGAFSRSLRARLGAEVFERDYFFAFARDRLTGKTHAGPGGAPPNPLYHSEGLDLDVDLETTVGPLLLRGGYGFQVIDDTYQGYYTSTAHHPNVLLRFAPLPELELTARGELWWRKYGPDSYAEGRGHPPLTFGDRRVDRLGRIELESRYSLTKNIALAAHLDVTIRRTNFPDYVPGVFPRGAQYDIRWNYDNWAAGLGVEYELGASSERE